MKRVLVDSLVASDVPGFACSKSKLVKSGIQHLRPFNIGDDGQLDLSDVYQVPEIEAATKKTRLEAGDILFNNTNSAELVGKAALVPRAMDAGFSNHLTRIRLNANLVEPAFFAFWLRHLRQHGLFTAQATRWVSQAAYKTSELRKVEIALPPIPEQRSIVDLLSRAEGIVRLRREAERKAAELIPALFLDMFGDPATNPKGWPVATVGDVLDAAEYGSSSKASSDGTGLPMIRMGNVTYAGSLDLADLKYVDLPAAEVERYSLREGDILFNRTNSKELVGKTGLWDGTRGAIVASYFIRLRVQRELLSPHYLWAFMNTGHMKRVIFDTARGAIGQSNINSKELKAFPLPVPPLLLQQQFALRCVDVSGLATQQSTATAKAQATFDALLANVFDNRGTS
jgi:type I restriction enzyme S subunit